MISTHRGLTNGEITNDPFFMERIGDFTIGQVYDDEPAKTIICPRCKNDKFLVGQGSYFTAVKCVNCDYEKCIHNG